MLARARAIGPNIEMGGAQWGPAGNDVDEDDRTVSKSILLVSFFQIALCSFYYTVVIPTSRLYAESLDAPDNFQAYMVGAAALGGAFMNPVYRWLLSKSFAGTMHFQLVCMQVGSLLYALAQVADKIELLIVGRLVGGCGSSVYPIYQYIAEEVGKNHRSEVISMISGFGKSFGFALGPIFAACLAYVDFNIGKLENFRRSVLGVCDGFHIGGHGFFSSS